MVSGAGYRRTIRGRIAQEAARFMIEGGISDFKKAKRKALDRLRIKRTTSIPSNEEVETARLQYHRIFLADIQPNWLSHMRAVAINAMQLTGAFEPRLVGSVLSGAADEHSRITLHLCCDPTEMFGIFLTGQNIRHRLSQRKLRLGRERFGMFPTYEFVVEDIPVDVLVFDFPAIKQCPLSPVDGRPMSRANRKQVTELLKT